MTGIAKALNGLTTTGAATDRQRMEQISNVAEWYCWARAKRITEMQSNGIAWFGNGTVRILSARAKIRCASALGRVAAEQDSTI